MNGKPTALLSVNEPPAFDVINSQADSNLVLLCDHASDRVPASLNNLGLGRQQLASHIGWDPGAADLSKALAERLGATLLMSNYSRLVIDCNRDPGAPDSIPSVSDGIVIPGNASLSDEQTAQRRAELFDPYHDAIRACLDARVGRATRLLSIHSFTPYLGERERPWSIGVCYRLDQQWAGQWLSALRRRTTDPVGDNEPYEIEEQIDYTLPQHGERRRLPGLMLEVRQDKLRDSASIWRWCELLADCHQSMR